ncbi:hypothetical protein CK203_015225 [Vitis vinifera]|uniref:Uncharacterized protein n=1 Tax=Vitis vinifera TaxID=29760 RepID=A0A438JKF1_VITVI|nr:hypothetical protein CK203_015225 [Vitis vinifera]
MAMEALFHILSKAKEGVFLMGCLVGGRELLFAHDMFTLCDVGKEYMKHLSWVLMWFEKVIIRKHEKKDGGWCSRVVRERYGVGVWKAIRCGWEAFNSRIKVTTKDAWIVEVWKQEGKRGCRNPHFSR